MAEQETRKVEIAVAIDEEGNFNAMSWDSGSGINKPDIESLVVEGLDKGLLEHIVWVEAEVPLPRASKVVGRVIEDG